MSGTGVETYEAMKVRGLQLKLSECGTMVLVPRSATDVDRAIVKREKPWLLMLLHHLVGGDAPDPRLAFLVNGDEGLTRGAIETRMQMAFGISKHVAHVLTGTAMAEGYLVTGRTLEILEPRGKTASGFEWKERVRA